MCERLSLFPKHRISPFAFFAGYSPKSQRSAVEWAPQDVVWDITVIVETSSVLRYQLVSTGR